MASVDLQVSNLVHSAAADLRPVILSNIPLQRCDAPYRVLVLMTGASDTIASSFTGRVAVKTA